MNIIYIYILYYIYIYILYIYVCIGNNCKYNYVMNIRAFVRGSNAVVVNKKSHGCTIILYVYIYIIYIYLYTNDPLSWDRSTALCTFVYGCTFFPLVRRVSAIAKEKGDNKKCNGKGENDEFSLVRLSPSSFPVPLLRGSCETNRPRRTTKSFAGDRTSLSPIVSRI